MDPASGSRTKGKAKQIEVAAEFLEQLAEQVPNQEQRKSCLDEAGRLRNMAGRLRQRFARPRKKNPPTA